MPTRIALTCPQCRVRLKIDFQKREKTICCPDCSANFVVDLDSIPELADRVHDENRLASHKSTPAISNSASHSSGSIGSTQSDGSDLTDRLRAAPHQSNAKTSVAQQKGVPASRATQYSVAKRRYRRMSELDELLQSLGVFLILMAAFSAILPLFDLSLGRFSLAGPGVLFVSLVVGLLGTSLLVYAQRTTPVVAIGAGIGLGLMMMVTWVANSDLHLASNPLRGELPTEQQDGKDSADDQEGGGPAEDNSDSDKTADPGTDDNLGGLDNLAPETPDDFANDVASRFVNEHDSVSEEMERRMQSFDTGRLVKESNSPHKPADLASRKRNLDNVSFERGQPTSKDFAEQFEAVMGGDSGLFGEAYYTTDQPLLGIDYLINRNKSTAIKTLVPILNQGDYSDSLVNKNGGLLSGLNLNFKDGVLLGVQAIFAKPGSGDGKLEVRKLATSRWAGRPPHKTEPVTISGEGRVVYGLVLCKKNDQIIGVGLILKKPGKK